MKLCHVQRRRTTIPLWLYDIGNAVGCQMPAMRISIQVRTTMNTSLLRRVCVRYIQFRYIELLNWSGGSDHRGTQQP